MAGRRGNSDAARIVKQYEVSYSVLVRGANMKLVGFFAASGATAFAMGGVAMFALAGH